jgi:hypothetical protein
MIVVMWLYMYTTRVISRNNNTLKKEKENSAGEFSGSPLNTFSQRSSNRKNPFKESKLQVPYGRLASGWTCCTTLPPQSSEFR